MKANRTPLSRTHFLILMALAAVPTLPAETTYERSTGFDFAYYPPDQRGYELSDGDFAPISFDVIESDGTTGKRDLGSSFGGVEAKGFLIQDWTYPALRFGHGPLVSGNTLGIRSTTGISPVSLTQEFQLNATPIAFLRFAVGGFAATGWNIGIFDGLGTVDTVTGEIDDGSFEGLVLRGYGSFTFQFDFAAVVPGEWNHVVIVYSPRMTWQTFTGGDKDEPWSFELDDGSNYRGPELSQTLFLGHQPPGMALSTVGFLLEWDRLVGSAKERGEESSSVDWDAGFTTLKTALVMNFAFGDVHSLTVLPQFRFDRLATPATVDNAAVQARESAGGYWDFYRVALSYRRSL